MENHSINIRIKQIIDYQFNGVVRKFAESINLPQQTINRLFNIDSRTGKYPLATTEVIVAITEMYVDVINPYWLIIGVGEMLKDQQKEPEHKEEIKFVDNNFLLDRLEKMAIENNDLRKELAQLKNVPKSTYYPKRYGRNDEELMVAEPNNE